MENLAQLQISREFLDDLQKAVDDRNNDFITNSLIGVKYEDVSEVLEDFNTEESKYVLSLLPVEAGANIISDLDEDDREKFLKSFTPEEIAVYLEFLDSDDAVDILNELPVKEREETIHNITEEEKVEHILDLLHYDEDCAGGLMAKELIKANLNWDVVRTIEEIRRQAEKVEKIYSVYVVDDQNVLQGRVALKEIILAKANKQIKDIYLTDIVSVPTYAEEEEVASLMRKYDLDAIPVVNVRNQLMGRITIDDIVDVIAEQAEEERQLMSGISSDVEQRDSVLELTKARIPWLIIGLVGGLLGAQFIEVFEEDLAKITAIAFFIPLITATGGNVGIQSSTLVVQSLANPLELEEAPLKKWGKVLLVALLNGLILSILVFLFIYFTGQKDYHLATVVAVALNSVVIIASVFGTFIPVILDKMGINPALASGPFITTANDLIGLAVYFTIVHYLYTI